MKSVCTLLGWSVIAAALAASLGCSHSAQSSSEGASYDAEGDGKEDREDKDGKDSEITDERATMPNDDSATKTPHASDEALVETLTQYQWQLADAVERNDKPVASLLAIKDQVTMTFTQRQDRQMLTYSVGCNTISAAYQLSAMMLEINDMMSTKMSCSTLNAAENRLNQLLQGKSRIAFDDREAMHTLTQVTAEGATLLWHGRLTARAKYGNNRETIFWAIDAQTQPCTSKPSRMCLQVRPIIYNDQGIKVSEGQRMEFAGKIDGYEHNSDFDHVLRLHRYPLAHDYHRADASTTADHDHAGHDHYAYVLDTVIEQSLAS